MLLAGGVSTICTISQSDEAKAMMHIRQTQASTDFLRHHLHQTVAISVVLHSGNVSKSGRWVMKTRLKIICRFFDGLVVLSDTSVMERSGLTYRCCTIDRWCTESRRRAIGIPGVMIRASGSTTT